METIYIVLYRVVSSSKWKAINEGEFSERRLAENLIECKRAAGYTWDFAIVEGPIVSQETMAQAEARLGEF